MPHFKAFGMINLQYEIIISQKIYNRVTTHNKSKYLVRNSLHQPLNIFYHSSYLSCNWYTNYTLLKEIKQTYLEKRTLVKNFSCRIQYSFYDEQPHGVGPDQNMKVQANGGMKYPFS